MSVKQVLHTSRCSCDSCAVAAVDDELIDDDNIDWNWDVDYVDPMAQHVVAKPSKGQRSKRGKKSRATKRQRTTAASTDDHSYTLSRIHATIQSLIAGEKVVQQTKADTLTRLADTLANYDSMVDDVIRGINDTRVRVKDDIRGVYESALKRLDGQIDELCVSIGQLAGLAALIVSNAQLDTNITRNAHGT